MLDIKKVKQMLENGEEVKLECVDEEKYLDLETNWRDSRQIILDSGLVVTGLWGIHKNNLEIDGIDRVIPNSQIEYFRIAEDNPTFDDVISAAVKAAIDGALAIRQLDEECLSVISRDGKRAFEKWRSESNAKDIANFINFINSLYTETFVIESEEEMKKMRVGSKGVLLNGLEFKVTDTAIKMFDGDNDLGITVNFKGMDHNELLYLSPLKGATVTQKI